MYLFVVVMYSDWSIMYFRVDINYGLLQIVRFALF